MVQALDWDGTRHARYPGLLVVCTGNGTHPSRDLMRLNAGRQAEVVTGGSARGVTSRPLRDGEPVGRVRCPSCGRQVNRRLDQLDAAAGVVDVLDISRV